MGQGATDTDESSWLVCEAGGHLCALPLDRVVETMRPQPLERIDRAPHFVRGISIIRGTPLPVVDTASLLGRPDIQPRRLVTVRVGERVIALSVDRVHGIRTIRSVATIELPHLLRDAAGDIVTAIGTLDSEFLLFLQTARILPDGLADLSAMAEAFQ
jgi:purine-binding chemotaxis protein CheW